VRPKDRVTLVYTFTPPKTFIWGCVSVFGKYLDWPCVSVKKNYIYIYTHRNNISVKSSNIYTYMGFTLNNTIAVTVCWLVIEKNS
jgi:hypothetical protein